MFGETYLIWGIPVTTHQLLGCSEQDVPLAAD